MKLEVGMYVRLQKRTKNSEITTKEQDKFLKKRELLKLKNG